jgi:hypothetical protein
VKNPLIRASLYLAAAALLTACGSKTSGQPASQIGDAGGVFDIPVGLEDPDLGFDTSQRDPSDPPDDNEVSGGSDAESDGNRRNRERRKGNAPVPEPGTWLLLGGGFAALTAARKRRSKSS